MATGFLETMQRELETATAAMLATPEGQEVLGIQAAIEAYQARHGLTTPVERINYMLARAKPRAAKAEQAVPTGSQVARGRTASPENAAIVEAVYEILQEVARKYTPPLPMPPRKLIEMLKDRGITVPGQKPANNLSAMLANAKDRFRSNGRSGWTLVENENPATAETLGERSGNGGAEDLLDQQVEPLAQGREAGPGGGA